MSHNPDFQKDEILAHKKRELEAQIAAAQAFASACREFRMQPISGAEADAGSLPQTRTLASRFESILFAPDYSTDERRAKLLAWAWENRIAITEALRAVEASHDQ